MEHDEQPFPTAHPAVDRYIRPSQNAIIEASHLQRHLKNDYLMFLAQLEKVILRQCLGIPMTRQAGEFFD